MTVRPSCVLSIHQTLAATARAAVLCTTAIVLTAAPALAQNSLFAPCAQWKTFEQAGLGETLRGAGSLISLVTFDLDGAGPDGETVLATTQSIYLNGQPTTPVIRWNGTTWVPVPTPPEFGGGTTLWVVESPDGTGKALYATTREFAADMTPVLYRWTGTEFAMVASLTPNTRVSIANLATFDADGPGGPAPREFYHIEAGGSGVTGLRRLRAGISEVVTPLAPPSNQGFSNFQLFEYAPGGEIPSRLVLAGPTSTVTNGFVIRGIAAYDGVSWSTLGDSLFGLTSTRTPTVTSAVIADPDGAGPLGETLIIAGQFRVGSQTGPAGLAYLQEDQWLPFGAGLTVTVDVSSAVRIVSIPQNNLSSIRPRLVIEGSFSTVDNLSLNRTAMLVGQAWQAFPASDFSYSWFAPLPTTVDFDGAGGNPPEIIFSRGRRNDPAVDPIPAIAFDGSNTRPLASQLISSAAARVFELRLLPDETGVLRLHAAGSFNYAGNRFIGSVAKLVNGSWQTIGTPLADTSSSVVVHDFDGPGPQPPTYARLATRSGEFQKLFVLDGQTWNEFPTTVAAGAATIRNTLESFDPDAEGPGLPTLLSTYTLTNDGAFNQNPSVLVGSTWRRLGAFSRVFNSYSPLVTFDADGPGGSPARLYINAGGLHRFDATTTDPATWESVPWTSLSSPSFGSALAVDRTPSSSPSFLFDAPVSQSALEAGGNLFQRFSQDAVTSAGLGFRPRNSSISDSQMTTWDFDGSGPLPASAIISPVPQANIQRNSVFGSSPWNYRASIASGGRWYGLGSPLTSLVSASGLLAYRPHPASGDEVLLQFGGKLSSVASDIFVFSANCPCSVADIADDAGLPLPTSGSNSGVTEGDYNHFFNAFFTASPSCDIADDQGNPLPAAPNVPNNGVTEADYNCFFSLYFNGCP